MSQIRPFFSSALLDLSAHDVQIPVHFMSGCSSDHSTLNCQSTCTPNALSVTLGSVATVVLEYPMLYTKFQGHQPLGSEEEEFWSFSSYMGMLMWPGTFEQIFIPHIPWRLVMKVGFNRPSGFWAKEVWKCWIHVTLDKGQWMTLTFDIHKGSCTHLVEWIYQRWYHRLQ